MEPRTWRSDVLAGIIIYGLTAMPVIIGFAATDPSFPYRLWFHFDGGHYLHLVEHGYRYNPDRASGVAFFPGYPLAAHMLTLTGLSARLALLIVSNIALIAAFAILSNYLRKETPGTRWCTLAILGLWPAGICFRVAYSESLLIALLALLMLGLSRRWPLLVLACIAGAATGVRAVGVAAAMTVLLHILLDPTRGTWKQRILTAAIIAPITCWGLIAYMIFQFVQFDTPLAFLQTQRHWSAFVPEDPSPLNKLGRLAIAEPVWNCYVPGSQRHWRQFNEVESPFLGSAFWNGILFLLAGLLVAFGWMRRWLTRDEAILGFGLLLIPYVTRADEQSMLSHSRFAAVVLPAYLVLGRMLGGMPRIVRCIAFILLAGALGLWSALFAAGRPLL